MGRGGTGRGVRLALAAAALVLVAACAAPQTRRLMQAPPADLPATAGIAAVPFHPQDRYQCGPAALATVFGYRGLEATPADLVDEVYLPERHGSLRTEMRAATRARGLVPYPLSPTLDDLLREIAAGNPVLVLQNLGLDWLPRWHYAVAVGYDLQAGEIVLRSGKLRRRITGLSTFERTWARADSWAQVIVPPDTPPVTASPLAWLRAVRELEQTDHAVAARTGYAAATRRWPQRPDAWMARGNAAWAADEPAAARTAFRRAVELARDEPAGWNNLAYALAATGEPAAAVRAARCATRLVPGAPGPKDTLAELSAGGPFSDDGTALPACPAGD